MLAFEDASPILTDDSALRSQMLGSGYLFLPGLLTAQTVHEVYAAILDVCREKGWADEEGNPSGDTVVEGEDRFWDVYDPLQRLELFHALAHRPEILSVIEVLVGETPFVHPRNISRIVYPQTEHFTTPAHQDFVHIQGTAETYTAWFPLTDCPQSMGSLVVLAGSHQQSLLPVQRASGAGGLAVQTDQLGLAWHGSDFSAGDVLIFHSHTVHKALPNLSDRLRISVDYRYQGLSQPIVEDGLQPHYNRLTWDEIYADWSRDELKYYWQDKGLQVSERDRSFHAEAGAGPDERNS